MKWGHYYYRSSAPRSEKQQKIHKYCELRVSQQLQLVSTQGLMSRVMRENQGVTGSWGLNANYDLSTGIKFNTISSSLTLATQGSAQGQLLAVDQSDLDTRQRSLLQPLQAVILGVFRFCEREKKFWTSTRFEGGKCGHKFRRSSGFVILNSAHETFK